MGLNGYISSVRNIDAGQRFPDNRYAPLPMASQIIVYERAGFEGRTLTVIDPLEDLGRSGFNDRASSVMVIGDSWELCEDVRFNGRCVVLRPGRYADLATMGMGDRLSSARAMTRTARVEPRVEEPRNLPPPPPVPAQVIFYEREGFDGRSFTADGQIDDFRRSGFNDAAASAVVMGERWEVCSDAGYRGNCLVLRPGRYGSLAAMGLNKNVSSVRIIQRDARIDDFRYAPAPVAVYDNRRRNQERLYEVNITSVRAVVGPAEQRCWIDREPVAQGRSGPSVGGGVVGALIGGVLGHQIGSGSGRDVATVGGAVIGGAIGANVGRDANGQQGQYQNVQRCENTVSQAAPAYWDVVYTFRGLEHRIQMSTQPGPTLTVNEQGEPRA
jgi:uncharacterized protein YcfJ